MDSFVVVLWLFHWNSFSFMKEKKCGYWIWHEVLRTASCHIDDEPTSYHYNWWVQPEFKIFGAKLPQIYQNESNIMVQQSHDTGNWCSNEYLHLKTSPIWEMRPTKDLSRGLWSVVNISGLCQLNVPLNLLSINAFHLRINNKLIKKLYDTHFKCCLSLRPVFKRSWRLKLNNLMTSCSVQAILVFFWKIP